MNGLEVSRALYYQDLYEIGVLGEHGYSGEARSLGVQVLVYAPDGRMFVRRDPDSGDRFEGHFFLDESWQTVMQPMGAGCCPDMGARINSAGGGVKPSELVEAASIRELRAELSEDLGRGAVTLRTDLPLLACYQRRNGNDYGESAYLMAVCIAEYYATEAEVELLLNKGMFVNFDNLLEMSKKREANGTFRPAFRTALWLVGKGADMSERQREHLATAINDAVIDASVYDAEQRGIDINWGLFAQAVQYTMLVSEGPDYGTT